MAEKPLPWFRLYHEAATDSKFDVISMTTGIEWCAVFGAWTKILCMAASSPIRGSLYVTFQKRFSNDNVTAMLRFTKETSAQIMQAFIDCDMLDIDEQGAYRVKNWDKRQYESDNSTKRVKKHREKEKETEVKRLGNVTVTPVSVSVSESSDESVNLAALEEKPEWLDEDGAISKLSKQFEVSAQIMAYEPVKWLAACREMFHAGVTPELLGHLIYEMRNPENGSRKLTITGPWSCTRMAIARASENRIPVGQIVDAGGSF